MYEHAGPPAVHAVVDKYGEMSGGLLSQGERILHAGVHDRLRYVEGDVCGGPGSVRGHHHEASSGEDRAPASKFEGAVTGVECVGLAEHLNLRQLPRARHFKCLRDPVAFFDFDGTALHVPHRNHRLRLCRNVNLQLGRRILVAIDPEPTSIVDPIVWLSYQAIRVFTDDSFNSISLDPYLPEAPAIIGRVPQPNLCRSGMQVEGDGNGLARPNCRLLQVSFRCPLAILQERGHGLAV
mmetsp:Transcript_52339/g.93428  ORF Transcript_52339/g.93428 Transcript_52339/m.93428 type:complete len:238 (+) Transcript_52339:938-1651(+)